MVKLKLRSPFRSDEPSENQGTRRSRRIQQQLQRQQRQERERLEGSLNNRETSNDRVNPGQRRSFDDITSPNNAPLGSSPVFRKIFSTSNKKSRRSNTSCTGNINRSSVAVAGGGVSASIRRATTMFRPSSSSSGRCEFGTFNLSTVTTFETVEVMDTSDDNVSTLSPTYFIKHATMHSSAMKSVLEWMISDAPPDVLPKILSFCGSRKVNALSKVNRAWHNNIVKNDLVWRVMCEDTFKWNEDDEVPKSWLQHYKDNPCLPFDYDSIDAAFEAISSGPRRKTTENGVKQYFREQRKSARILLQPGPYFLRRALVCNVIGTAHLTIECLRGSDPQHGILWSRNYHKYDEIASQQHPAHTATTARPSSILNVRRPSSATLRQVFGCRFMSHPSDTTPGKFCGSDEGNISELLNGIRNGDYPLSCVNGANPTAYLILESRRENEPCVRVRKGTVTLRGLKFLHYAEGNDIWNGNAAIQVQAPFDGNGRPLQIVPPSIVPTVNVFDCDIMSMSGRGVVSIDGGISRVDNCNIHNSAATGLYLGGTGSMATITRTDIFENGNGNDRVARGGVASGHSGIYVEQGVAKIFDCNISKNSLTGVSAVSQEHATLQIENSDLKSNGSVQVELPPIGSPSRGRSFSRGNNISVIGQGRPRSRFLKEMTKGGNGTDGPIGGVFPPLPQSPSEFPHDNVTRVAIRAGQQH